MKIEDILEYEASNSMSRHISNGYLQTLFSRYLAWKVKRKWKRYMSDLKIRVILRETRNNL